MSRNNNMRSGINIPPGGTQATQNTQKKKNYIEIIVTTVLARCAVLSCANISRNSHVYENTFRQKNGCPAPDGNNMTKRDAFNGQAAKCTAECECI